MQSTYELIEIEVSVAHVTPQPATSIIDVTIIETRATITSTSCMMKIPFLQPLYSEYINN